MTVKGEALSVGVLFSARMPCVGKPKPDWVGRAGHGRHGGEASALCVGTDDVGLEFSFADFALPQHSSSKLGSAFGLRKIRFLFFKKKEERKTHNPPKFRIFEA